MRGSTPVVGKSLATSGLATTLLIFMPYAGAADIGAGLTVGVAYSDNIDRTPTADRDETIAQGGIDFAVTEATRRIQADARGSLYYYDYIDNTYENQTVGAIDALVDITIVPERLNWLVQENYGRNLFDPFQADRPENWENLNFFTTGPTIVLYRSGRNDIGMDLRYSRMDYEIRPFDNERNTGRLWIGREIRRDHHLSLNAEVEAITFDNGGLSPDYDRRSGYLRYTVETGRNQLVLDAGYTQQEILEKTDGGVRFNVGWIRTLSSQLQLSLNAGRQFADQANVFRYQQDITRDVDSVGDFTENGSPFLWTYTNVGLGFETERTVFQGLIGLSEEEYETQSTSNRRNRNVDLHFQRDFTRALYGEIDATFYWREFSEATVEDDTLRASVALGYRLSAAFDLSLRYTYVSRNSNQSANEFEENRGEVMLTYIPRWGAGYQSP
jgi:Putative beta-barrel porin 2